MKRSQIASNPRGAIGYCLRSVVFPHSPLDGRSVLVCDIVLVFGFSGVIISMKAV